MELNQKGIISIPILIAIIGVVAFLALVSSAPFKNDLLTAIFPKDESHAAAGDLSGSTFFETFTGGPAAPEPFKSPRWDIQVHERGIFGRPLGQMISMNAQHGADCAAPPATHTVNTVDQSVFNCRDHIMTSINGDEYGVIYLTPDHLLDWSSGQAVLSFDISTEKMSGRDWPDILLTPWADQQALPLLSPLSEGVDLQGPSKNTLSLSFATGEGSPILTIIRNNARQEFIDWTPLASNITAGTNQSATRQPLKITIGNDHIRFERPASATGQAIVFFDQAISPPLTFNQAVVQLGHHSYNPFKDNSGVAATWHWDNVSLNPAKPFTMLPASPRQITDSGTITFPPAPANAILRFSAIGRPIVNGVSRDPVTYQGSPEHFSSYNVPITQGATSATITMTKHDWYEHGYMAKDFAVWSANQPISSPQPSPTPQISPSPSPIKPGDIDGNNKVDIFDYNLLLTDFGKSGPNLIGDIDKNNKVDIFDFNLLLTNFGK